MFEHVLCQLLFKCSIGFLFLFTALIEIVYHEKNWHVTTATKIYRYRSKLNSILNWIVKFVPLPSPTAECKALVFDYTDLEEIILMDHTAVGQVLDQSVRQCRFTPVCDPMERIICITLLFWYYLDANMNVSIIPHQNTEVPRLYFTLLALQY